MTLEKNISWKILYYILGLLAMLIVNAILIVYSNNRISDTNEKTLAVQEVETNLEALESSVLRGWDTGLRGYFITRKQNIITPYTHAFAKSDTIFGSLYANMAVLEQRMTPIDSLREIITGYGDYVVTLKKMFDSAGIEPVRTMLADDWGEIPWKRYDRIRSDLKADLAIYQNQMNTDVDNLQRRVLVIQVGSFLITLILFVLIYRKITVFARDKNRYIFQIKRANDALQNLQRNLQTEVEHKTEDLEKSNEELMAVIDNMQKMQTQMLQSEKMASLGTMTSGIAHEFNNALNYVKGGYQVAIDLAAQSMNGKSSEEHLTLIRTALDEGVNRMEKIVHSLQIFSNHDEKSLQETNVDELIDNALSILKSVLTKDIDLKLSLELSENLWLNKANFQHLLIQLLDNAIAAVKTSVPTMGKVIGIETSTHGKYARLIIYNNGPKIPESAMRSIFDPFYSTKEPGLGTGLGLAICYAIVTEIKGNIYARNEKEGVAFVVEIPLDLKT